MLTGPCLLNQSFVIPTCVAFDRDRWQSLLPLTPVTIADHLSTPCAKKWLIFVWVWRHCFQ